MATINQLQHNYASLLQAIRAGALDGVVPSMELEAIDTVAYGLYIGLLGSADDKLVKNAEVLWLALAAQDYTAAYALAQAIAVNG